MMRHKNGLRVGKDINEIFETSNLFMQKRNKPTG